MPARSFVLLGGVQTGVGLGPATVFCESVQTYHYEVGMKSLITTGNHSGRFLHCGVLAALSLKADVAELKLPIGPRLFFCVDCRNDTGVIVSHG